MRYSKIRTLLLAGCAGVALSPAFALAQSQPQPRMSYDIPAQDLGAALTQFGQQSEREIVFSADLARNKKARAVAGEMTSNQALAMLLGDTGLTYRTSSNGSIIVEASDPQSGSAAGDGADGTVAALIVTAQKREENIQDVPIAISAFSQKTLDEQKIEGGFDLLKAIPNVTFSKNNFSSYNFSIRGIGTKAVSVTTDPGVAVAFNSSSLIRNRLFEQEYFDIERVEVLRGPQGTLYGRNATAGVINVISAKPNMNEFKGSLKGEVGNYHSKRLSAMINVPLVEDKLAVRLAGALTNRDGYDFNSRTNHAINGRDLWSARVTVGFNPTEALQANLIWERFEEDDDRSRTGKQLCYRDPGRASVGGKVFQPDYDSDIVRRAYTSQGCLPGSLYDDAAFGTPNGLSIPFVLVGTGGEGGFYNQIGLRDGERVNPIKLQDPYGGLMQSRDLRVIDSIRDPVYRAKTDVVELNVDWDLSASLNFTSQTAYVKDVIYSFQDYNRFNTLPIFEESSDLEPTQPGLNFKDLLRGGIYCDPQIGCADSIAGFDISRAKSTEFSQEFRLQSNFDGRFNFSSGANYLHYRTIEDYFVFFNIITLLAQATGPFNVFNASQDYTTCIPRFILPDGTIPGFADLSKAPVSLGDPAAAGCIYIDPNPIENVSGDGHNYFRSKNPYRLQSWSAFGEAYWEFSEKLKLRAGLRYTDDRKTFTPVPSQTLLSSAALLLGTVDRGYPELPDIKQHWGEFSGRLGLDWKPDVSFTEDTLIYAVYSRGYKGGGANPPGIGFSTEPCAPFGGTPPPGTRPCSQTLPYPKVFDPEFINALELGSKNTLLGGALVLNGDVFYYDYKDYQVSQIKDRTAVNENFDAQVWGLEMEAMFSPTRNLRFNGAFGYQNTRIADGEQSLDLMDRLQGHDDYMVLRPWIQMASNCVAPISIVEAAIETSGIGSVCPGSIASNDTLDPSLFPNGGAGFFDDLSGNELPNAPHWTISLGGQYGFEFLTGWRAVVRSDAYWQSQSWARVYNAVNDKLHGWYNLNLSLWLENDDGLKIEIYAKNLLDKTPITDAFLNSDDTGLTTNVFVLDPRLIGLSIKKDF